MLDRDFRIAWQCEAVAPFYLGADGDGPSFPVAEADEGLGGATVRACSRGIDVFTVFLPEIAE